MTYPGLFSSYQPLKGRDWLKHIPPEDRKPFVDIGLQEAGHGQKGGRALYMQKGRAYMSEIGRRGAIATNTKKAIERAEREKLYDELGVTFDF